MPQSSLGFVVVDGNTGVFEKGKVFLFVFPQSRFDFGERSWIKGVTFRQVIENRVEFSFEMRG